VPYVNAHDRDGAEVTDFTAINANRCLHAGQQRLCGLCGTALGYWISFFGGPNAIRFRAFSDPPAHPACSLVALGLCPHIAMAHARRATPRRVHADTRVPVGFHDAKPTEWCLGITRDYGVRIDRGSDLPGGPVQVGPLLALRLWWCLLAAGTTTPAHRCARYPTGCAASVASVSRSW
jgi:hypothetical protein